MKLTYRNIQDIRLMFEDMLRRNTLVDRMKKIEMRSRIRCELNRISMLINPTSDNIFRRLEDKLGDLFSLFPFWFRDDFKKLLSQIIETRR